MSGPTQNDLNQAADEAARSFCKIVGKVYDESYKAAMLELIEKYPPDDPDVKKGPCRHGFDESFWCSRCKGTIAEDYSAIEKVPQ
jgi:hypothetical protein